MRFYLFKTKRLEIPHPGSCATQRTQNASARARPYSRAALAVPRKTTVNPINHSNPLSIRLLMGNLAMLKRILFLALTAFVITLPITGIWSLSWQTQHSWNEDAPQTALEPEPETAALSGVNQYLRSLRYLINDHESFGPFT